MPSRHRETLLNLEKIAATALKATLMLALATPLIVLRGQQEPLVIFPHVVGKAFYFRLLVQVAFALWVPLLLWAPTHRLPKSWLAVILTLFLLFALLSAQTGVSSTRSFWSTYERMQGWIGLVHYVAYAVMLASVFRTFQAWRQLLNGNLLIGCLVGLAGVLQMTQGESLRISSTLGNPTFLGAYALVNALMAAGLLLHSFASPHVGPAEPSSQQKRQPAKRRPGESWPGNFLFREALRVFWALALSLNLLMLYQSGTRGAIVGLAAGMGLFLVLYAAWGKFPTGRKAAGALAVVGLVLLGTFLLVRDTVVFERLAQRSLPLQRLADIGLNDANTRSRLNSVFAGIDSFADRPLLGWGLENYSPAYDRHITEEAMTTSSLQVFDKAHNQVIEVLVTTGLVGLAAYLAIWLCLAWILIKRIRLLAPDAQLLTMLMGAALVGYFVQNLFLFDAAGSAFQLYLLIGFVIFLETNPARGVFAPRSEHRPDKIASAGLASQIDRLHTAGKVGLTVSAALVALVCFNYAVLGPYTAVRSVTLALTGERRLSERIEFLERAFQAAPGMTNFPLLAFLEELHANWEALPLRDRPMALEFARDAGDVALAKEPWEWRFHSVLARLYMKASLVEPAFLNRSRVHTEQAMNIAPNRFEMLVLQVLQHQNEGEIPKALHLIDAYYARNEQFLSDTARVYRRLTELRAEIAALE